MEPAGKGDNNLVFEPGVPFPPKELCKPAKESSAMAAEAPRWATAPAPLSGWNHRTNGCPTSTRVPTRSTQVGSLPITSHLSYHDGVGKGSVPQVDIWQK